MDSFLASMYYNPNIFSFDTGELINIVQITVLEER